jgi:hypothetical protein
MSGLKLRFGRSLRLGIIGGGPDAWIGRMYRGAAEMDGWWRAVAGVFSSDPARSRAAGVTLGFDAARSFAITSIPIEVWEPDGLEAAFATMRKQRANALFVVTDPLTLANRKVIVDLAASNRIPAGYDSPDSFGGW